MKASLNWLSDHLDLSDLSAAEIDQMLTDAGVEVEEIHQSGVEGDKVVVGQVLSSDKHPDADKLSVCKIDVGDRSEEPLQIVCGAKNYAVGDRVPVALHKAVLPNGMKIKKGKLRGVVSQGMLCSATELGMADESDGLMILEGELSNGTPVGEVLEGDTVFDIEITPNRPDLLSHLGLGRELAALTGRPLKGATDHSAAAPASQAADDLVRIDDLERCPHYTLRRITGVEVKASPAWLKTKLEAIGLRPINNIVDITNYVLMEMGHPLHAFDATKVEGGIVVRRAQDGESLVALDGESYDLLEDDLVIADQAQPLAIAGVMGGEGSGVVEGTTDILLESAYFWPTGVRATSRRLNLSSDSSYRFERGADPQQVAGASDLATKLILELAGGEVVGEFVEAGQAIAPPADVALSQSHIQSLIGAPIPAEESDAILTKLGLSGGASQDGSTTWSIPSYRRDLERPVDLIEEVARVVGLDAIPASTAVKLGPGSADDAAYDFAMGLRRRLTGAGFSEAITLKLISDAQLADVLGIAEAAPEARRLKLPLSDDHTTLRPSLVPGLLAVLDHNVRMGAGPLRHFEIGTCFNATESGVAAPTAPDERQHLSLALAGPQAAASHFANPAPDAELGDLRGVLDALAPGVEISLAPSDHPALVAAAAITAGGQPIGMAGQLDPARAREMDIATPVLVAEVDLAALQAAAEAAAGKFCELPKFPAITRDIAMEVSADLPAADLATFFKGLDEPLLIGAQLFDLFSDPTGEKVAADKRSLAYSLTYRSPERTLEAAEVDAAHASVLEQLKAAFEVAIR